MAVAPRTRRRNVSGGKRTAPGLGLPADRRRGRAAALPIAVVLLAAALLLVGQASAGAGTPPAAPLDPPSTLNVMVFNIEDGGTLVSFAKVAEAIKASGADIVGIEEAQGHVARLARLLGWPYFSTRLQIVSRYPLIDPPGGGGIYLFVEPAPGKVVAIMNVHLPSDPYGPDWVRDGKSAAKVIALEKSARLPAVQSQLAALPFLLARQIPVFLTGDFNSPSFLDWTPAAVDTRTYDNGKKPWPPIALEWPVSKVVVGAGFRDSFRDVYPDPVANPGLTWWATKPHVAVADENFGPLDPKDRIDYVYAAGPSVTTASRIVGEVGGPEVSVSVSPWPSDHRGRRDELRFTPATSRRWLASPFDHRLVDIGKPLEVTFHAPGRPSESVTISRTTASPTAPPVRRTINGRRGADRRHADLHHEGLRARPLPRGPARRQRQRALAYVLLDEGHGHPPAGLPRPGASTTWDSRSSYAGATRPASAGTGSVSTTVGRTPTSPTTGSGATPSPRSPATARSTAPRRT